MAVVKGFSAKFIGMDLFDKMLQDLPSKLSKEANESAREGALDVVRESKRIVAVDTGFLKESIFVRELDYNNFEIIAAAPYAGYIEYGTYKMVARPFIRPALFRFSGTWKKKILDRFERAIRGYF